MTRYLSRRLLQTIPVLFVISVGSICFDLFNPGRAAQGLSSRPEREQRGQIARLEQEYGFDINPYPSST